ncbi:MAG: SsrA-binding protein SmpB [Anaerolineae bacterium]|jgi:SsrA-binding protein|nr:SsrA-binding protein SmpB [Chloroflexota bacterium]
MARKREASSDQGPNRTIAHNRKAFHDYAILETMEAGIALHGSEIKSIRAGRVNLRDSFVTFREGEAWLVGTHIAGYNEASYLDHDPTRDRKLLLHRREIIRLRAQVEQRGFTVVPTRLYLKNNRAKVEIGVARGKHTYDKRESLRERDSEREIAREIKSRMQ